MPSSSCFFFRRTNKGGKNSGEGSVRKSKLIQISQLIQRRFFWICNLVPTELWSDDKFLANLLNKLAGKTINIAEEQNNFEQEDDDIFD